MPCRKSRQRRDLRRFRRKCGQVYRFQSTTRAKLGPNTNSTYVYIRPAIQRPNSQMGGALRGPGDPADDEPIWNDVEHFGSPRPNTSAAGEPNWNDVERFCSLHPTKSAANEPFRHDVERFGSAPPSSGATRRGAVRRDLWTTFCAAGVLRCIQMQ